MLSLASLSSYLASCDDEQLNALALSGVVMRGKASVALQDLLEKVRRGEAKGIQLRSVVNANNLKILFQSLLNGDEYFYAMQNEVSDDLYFFYQQLAPESSLLGHVNGVGRVLAKGMGINLDETNILYGDSAQFIRLCDWKNLHICEILVGLSLSNFEFLNELLRSVIFMIFVIYCSMAW